MEKAAYAREMGVKLRELDARLAAFSPPPPATKAVAVRQDELKSTVREARTRIAAAVQDVDALAASSDPHWDAQRENLDRRWREIEELARPLVESSPI